MATRSEETLRNAVKRLISGPGHHGTKLYGIGHAAAQIALEEAIAELVALRGENAAWVCQHCRIVYRRQGPCPTCEEPLVPQALVRVHAYEQEIEDLKDRIVSLERVALQSLGLSTDTEA